MHAVLGALANLIRASTRCMFPLAALGVWLALLLVPQGTDVLRAALERLQYENSSNDLLFLWAGSGLLALSIWYSMRWLITAQMSALPLSGRADSWPRIWLPRLCGAAVPGLVVLVVLWPGMFPTLKGQVTLGFALAFAVQAVALLLFFWKRAAMGRQMQGATGRTADGQPGELAVDEPLPPFTVRVLGWALMLTALLGLVFLLFALTAPRIVGSAAAAAIALASINLFGSFVLTYLPMRKGLPPLAPWVLAYAMAIGAFNDNHGPRPAMQATPLPAQRIAPKDAFVAWRQGLAAGDFYIVAAEGGGLRAAYWTAAVLEQLQKSLPGFDERVFALSGVSGGSVGVATWVAAQRPRYCDSALTATPMPSAVGSLWPRASKILAADYLSPSVASLFYDDLAQRFVPFPFPALDRSRGLEEGWERAAYRIPGRPLEQTLDGFYQGCRRLPELLLNATVAETGQRAILTRLHTGSFVDTRDVSGLSTTTQSVAGLMHHSARFPLISPAGSVRSLPPADAGFWQRLARRWWPDTQLRLVDGGYFDNSGMQTALELALQLRGELAGLRPVLIFITSDAGSRPLCAAPSASALCPALPVPPQPAPAPVWRWFHESTPPLRGLFNVRDSHVRVLAQRAITEFGAQVVVLQPRQAEPDGFQPPLGWALSSLARERLSAAAPQAVAPFEAIWQVRP